LFCHVILWRSTQVIEPQSEIPQDAVQRACPDLFAASRDDRPAAAELHADVPAFPTLRLNRGTQPTKLAQELAALHLQILQICRKIAL
jgi:hypothetical protein